MSGWLIRFGLGGVQPFIAESRKLRDFAAASRLFSDLCRSVADAAPRNVGVMLPVREATRDGRTLQLPYRPHQITVRADVDADGARTIGNAMVEMARDWWRSNALIALRRGRSDLTPQIVADETDIRAQLETALEAYWVGVPIESDTPDTPDGVATAFKELMRAFDARGRTRTFPQIPELSNGEPWACSQCGTRPAVTARPKVTAFPLDSKGERLCAVCLAKRCWRTAGDDQQFRFDSTHEVARDRYFRDPALRHLRDDPRFDESLLRIDDADDEELKAEARKIDSDSDSVWLRLREIDDRCSPYYALVRFDGDKMGKWFSDLERFKSGTSLREAHRALGESLVVFAHGLQDAIRDRGARLVYAGGDDGFVIAPLDSLLGFMKLIHERWVESMNELHTVVALSQPLPTLSLHASIVHAKAPLQPALARVKDLLEGTKEAGGRNAFSILADIRAGASALFIGKWPELPAFRRAVIAASNWRRGDVGWLERHALDADAHRTYQKMLNLRRERRFPASLMHNLADAAGPYFNPENGRLRYAKELRNEMIRLASRSGGSVASPEGARKTIADRHAATLDWFVSRGEGIRNDAGKATLSGEEALRSTLEVVGFLARELSWKPMPSAVAGAEPEPDAAAIIV